MLSKTKNKIDNELPNIEIVNESDQTIVNESDLYSELDKEADEKQKKLVVSLSENIKLKNEKSIEQGERPYALILMERYAGFLNELKNE